MAEERLDRFDARQAQTLRYCVTCPKMCRFACPVAHEEAREAVTPWGLVSLIHGSVQNSGTLSLDAGLADVLQRCTGCLRCQSACVHDNDVPSVVNTARALAREAGLIDVEPSRRGLATRGSEHPIDGRALGFAAEASIAFVPSCSLRDDALHGLRRHGRLLRDLGIAAELVPTAHDCCGAPLLEAGMEGLWRDRFIERAAALSGFDTVVTDCDDWLAHCAKPWGQRVLQRAGVGRVVHWTELVADRLSTTEPQVVEHVVWHAGCRLGRGAGVYDAPRRIVDWATGNGFAELPDIDENAQCCGAGGGYEQHDAESARALADSILGTLPAQAVLVTSRPQCVSHFSECGDIRVLGLFDLVTTALGWTT